MAGDCQVTGGLLCLLQWKMEPTPACWCDGGEWKDHVTEVYGLTRSTLAWGQRVV